MNQRFNLLCLLSFLFVACSAQQNKSISEDNKTQTKEDFQDSLTIKSQPTAYIDPLFFVDGQLCQHLRELFQDSKGNIWMGTNIYGLMRYDGDTLEYFDRNIGLNPGRITGIAEDEKGNVWFGSSTGLIKYDPVVSEETGVDSFTTYTIEDGLIDNEIWSLLIDRQGVFWIGTMEGVSRFDGERFTTISIPHISVKDTTTILSYNRISCILEDRKGMLWFGTDGFGICKYNPHDISGIEENKFTHITSEDGLCDNNISCLLEDKKGDVLIGTMYGGISKFDGASYIDYTKNGDVEGIEISDIYEDKKGVIWFASEGFGIYSYDGVTFTNYNEDSGLESLVILSILEDNAGQYWFGGWGGLFRYFPSELTQESIVSVSKDGPWK